MHRPRSFSEHQISPFRISPGSPRYEFFPDRGSRARQRAEKRPIPAVTPYKNIRSQETRGFVKYITVRVFFLIGQIMENYKPFCAVCQAMLLPAACFRQCVQIACLSFGQITSDTKQQKAVAHSVTASAFFFCLINPSREPPRLGRFLIFYFMISYPDCNRSAPLRHRPPRFRIIVYHFIHIYSNRVSALLAPASQFFKQVSYTFPTHTIEHKARDFSFTRFDT